MTRPRAMNRIEVLLRRMILLADHEIVRDVRRRVKLLSPHPGMPELYGNTTGLSASATRALERIYRRRVPSDRIATPELVRSLSDASRETKRQVGALVHRSGEVDYVIVGHATGLMLPDIGRLRAPEGTFRALPLVHTHLWGEPLTRDDIVD